MQPRKALVIDDSNLIHKLFRLILSKTNLVSASNGVEALLRLAEHPDIDMIFLDINMPKMNGLELLAKIKADAGLAAIPVVIISTEGKEHDVIRGLQGGAAAYVKKPFNNQEILDLVSRVMEIDEPTAVRGGGRAALIRNGSGTTPVDQQNLDPPIELPPGGTAVVVSQAGG